MNKKVLYIEDNEQNLYLVRFLLEKNGFAVKEATDGITGISMALADRPDIILLDIQLPAIDGYHIIKMIREKEELRDIPVVAVSSYAMLGDREKAIAAGCNGYIEKPIDPDTFVSRISGYIRGEK